MTETENKPREIRMSRRLFFALAIGGGTAACVGALSLPGIREKLFRKIDQQSLEERVIAEATANRRSWVWTLLETLGVFAGIVALGNLIDRLFNIKHGGRAADGELYAEQADSAPVSLYVRDCIVIPVIEEGFFRLLPSALFAEEKSPNVRIHWGTGLTSAAIFAGIHNFSKPEPDIIAFHLDSIPIEQFALGTYCWWAQRRGGFVHAAGGHVLYNNLCEAWWHFYESRLPQEENDSTAD